MRVVFKTTGTDEYPRLDISSGYEVFADLDAVFAYYFGGTANEPWATLHTTITTAFAGASETHKLFEDATHTYWVAKATDRTI